MNLPAFLLSKNLVPDSLGGFDLRRGVLLAEDRAIFSNDCRQKRPLKYKTRRRAPGIAAMCLAASREAQLVLSRANKAPHYRICSLDYFRPDCESPARPGTFRMHRAICYLTKQREYVKPFTRHFSLTFHTPVEAVGNHASQPFLGEPEGFRKARGREWGVAPCISGNCLNVRGHRVEAI